MTKNDGPVSDLAADLSFPHAERLDLVEHLPAPDGTTAVADPYRWLEDRDDARTKAWSAEQDELYATHRETWDEVPQLAERLDELTQVGFIGPPVWRDGRCFFMRRLGTQEHAVLVCAEGDSERVLLDPMELDEQGTTTLDSWSASPDGSLVAFSLSEGGSEESALSVMNVASGDVVDGPIDRARFSSVSWLPDSASFVYMRQLASEDLPAEEQQYHRRVYWHTVGEPAADDVEVFGADQPMTAIFGQSVSYSGAWLTISVSYGTDPRNDVYLARLESATPHVPTFTTVVEGIDARFGVIVDRDDHLWVHTDHDAPRGKVLRGTPENPTPAHWQVVLAEPTDAVIEDFALVGTGDSTELLVCEASHTVSRLTRRTIDGTMIGPVELPGVGATGGLITKRGGGDDVWFVYTDHVTSPQVRHYQLGSDTTTLYKAPQGAAKAEGIHSQLIEFTSKDGTTVRAFVVSPADSVDASGAPLRPLPTMLNGYGGFGLPMAPGYSATNVAWVERGGRAVVACLRGGGEEGEQWHRDGMLDNKQNVFDDFYACAEALVDRGFTTSEHLGIMGGSNGGLLVGAALTQRPELFSAVVCSAPLLDMVRFSLHGLGQFWVGEYGDATDPEQLQWLLSYSPYHNVHEGKKYPATLFTVFEGDSRVDPLHARKLAAALQYASSGSAAHDPILVRREENVGHGARARSKGLTLTADILTFMGVHTGWPTT